MEGIVNILIVSGRLGKDAELRYTPKGTAVLEFSLAVSDPFKKDKPLWLEGVLFGDRAEKLQQYMIKGKHILLDGKLDVNINRTDRGTWTNVKIIVNFLEFLGGEKEQAAAKEKPAEEQEDTPPEEHLEDPEETQ